jgi:DEAD/DEAH box helicase domain-containing protein
VTLASLLEAWRSDPDTGPNISTWRSLPGRPARLADLPDDLPACLAAALTRRGISRLFSHQSQAWQHARDGYHLVVATGTASGKTLAFQLPVLSALLENPQARALLLYPTKALAQDQLSSLNTWLHELRHPPQVNHEIVASIYDGDTPASRRTAVRDHANILLSNPDMLHMGILPHHTNWESFFQNLRFIVLDEVHTYRGVFGSHVANLVRRLKRIAQFYGAHPQFIMTSATIGNPQALAEKLIEAPVALVDQDGSGRGERHFLIFNPPVVDPSLGIRKSAVQEGVRLAKSLYSHQVQSVVFTRSRRSVEIFLKYLQESTPNTSLVPDSGMGGQIRGYRSGYLPGQRREIEKGLRSGHTRLVVATNALELGIDIGGLGAALLIGYPGTIASTWQQAGRAGRGDDPAAAILVSTAAPLDQFLAHHPDYFLERSPEQALINPDHLLILLNHLRCAAFELPFQSGEKFGSLASEQVGEFLDFLVSNQELHFSADRYFWMADAYPADNLSLRSASASSVVLQVEDGGKPFSLGQVDLASACWMVHPGAVYLHEAQQFFVQELDLVSKRAMLIPVALDYFTEPLRQTDISLLALTEQLTIPGGTKNHGEIQVTTQVTGFRKRQWLSGENLGEEQLEMEPGELQTTGYWITLSETVVNTLREAGDWKNDVNDYGRDWPVLRAAVRQRDEYHCQVCGLPENGRQHDVHHKQPFRQFASASEANRMNNLVTLCPTCHRKAEANVRMRSGLSGLASVLGQLAPLFLMCDTADLGIYADPKAAFADNQPAVALYDHIPAGIGFSQKLFEMHAELIARALELVQDCPCQDGCPSCVGPAGENGVGGRQETLAILKCLVADCVIQ